MTAFANYNEARRAALSRGASSFNFKSADGVNRKYVRGQWANGVTVFRRSRRRSERSTTKRRSRRHKYRAGDKASGVYNEELEGVVTEMNNDAAKEKSRSLTRHRMRTKPPPPYGVKNRDDSMEVLERMEKAHDTKAAEDSAAESMQIYSEKKPYTDGTFQADLAETIDKLQSHEDI